MSGRSFPRARRRSRGGNIPRPSRPRDGRTRISTIPIGCRDGGGFGRPGTPGGSVKTEWLDEAIWLRRTFEIDDPENLEKLLLRFHHDDDAVVYLNGVKIADLPGHTTRYEERVLEADAVKALQAGENVLAVHCRQQMLGQFIDVGIVEWQVRHGPKE